MALRPISRGSWGSGRCTPNRCRCWCRIILTSPTDTTNSALSSPSHVARPRAASGSVPHAGASLTSLFRASQRRIGGYKWRRQSACATVGRARVNATGRWANRMPRGGSWSGSRCLSAHAYCYPEAKGLQRLADSSRRADGNSLSSTSQCFLFFFFDFLRSLW